MRFLKNILNWVNKIRAYYSFNFLVIMGWIIFLVCYNRFLYYSQFIGGAGFAGAFIYLGALACDIIFFIIAFIILFFEKKFLKSNKKFSNNIFLCLFQLAGIIFALFPILLFIHIVWLTFLENKDLLITKYHLLLIEYNIFLDILAISILLFFKYRSKK